MKYDMKENKFRVWEPINKKMHYVDFALYQFSDGINSHQFILPTGHQGFQNPYTSMNLDAVTVMQYTGLHDRTGKPIYEGDLVTYELDGEQYGASPVVFEEGMYCLESDFPNTLSSYQNLKVIGNLYETPQLNKQFN